MGYQDNLILDVKINDTQGSTGPKLVDSSGNALESPFRHGKTLEEILGDLNMTINKMEGDVDPNTVRWASKKPNIVDEDLSDALDSFKEQVRDTTTSLGATVASSNADGSDSEDSSNMLDKYSDLLNTTVSSLVTKFTGSPTAGVFAGNAVNGLLGKGGAAGVAGPIGAALLVGSEINDFKAKIADAAIKGLASATSANTSDPLSLFAGGSRKATQALDPLQALTGINLNTTDDVLRSFIDAIVTITDNFTQLSATLEGFSPDVAEAQAEREIRQIERNLRRGEELGPQLSEFTRAQTNATEAIEELKEVAMRELLPIATAIMDNIAGVLQFTVAAKRVLDKAFLDEDSYTGKMVEFAQKQNESVGGMLFELTAMSSIIGGPFLRKVKRELEKMASEEIRQPIEDFLDPDEFIGSMLSGMAPPSSAPGIGEI